MKKKNKKYLIAVSAFSLCLVATKISSSYATNDIDLDRYGSLTITVEDASTYGTDVVNADIHVNIYKIADRTENGSFTSVENFAELGIDSITQKEEWTSAAIKAKEIVENSQITSTTNFVIRNGVGSANQLDQGLYLILTENTNTDIYTYSFNPYIISIPNDLYYQTGDGKDDYWIYDVTAGLKPERNNRYGSLKITKTVQEFNETLKSCTFVFDVEGKDENDKVIYSNVVSTTFDEGGSKEVILDNIPAGTKVTVTEVYSGASYTLTSEKSKMSTIIADEVINVDFSNTYNDELKPGYGVTNHFDYSEEEGWQWSQLSDNTQQ